MQKKWWYGILGYVFLMIGVIAAVYIATLIWDISFELIRAYESPDDLCRYSSELEMIGFVMAFGGPFIFAIVLFLFFNALFEEETIEDRKGEEKIEPYYYEILGVSKGASLDEIKKAYREASLQFHPDGNEEKDAREKFIMIKKAYKTLSDPDKREEYDRKNRE